MNWNVLREDSPNTFTPVTDDPPPSDCVRVNGAAQWNDGFADDWSEWGDEESNFISAKQLQWQSEDSLNRSFACSWAP